MRNCRKIVLVAILAGFAVGCANSTTTWSKTGVGMKQAAADLKECAGAGGLMYEGKGLDEKPVAYVSKRTYTSTAGVPFEKCIMGKGYKK
ncbi:MAG: hypothetical protein HOC91_12330 [Nitrospinaceae bacterium]|jgi:hypothetical protein|nr:hypothetical protein [Nitrospinaceae bacterium]MBT3822164.1 hypothetical protein [Nitrospinaceae bacterium]MBT4095118.1 hypothetical protein [Nitrospinaceae bacterium]MBT4431296.1 hypothetical protein [Nitrospinaceae bacterium]MBT5369479.1 hypothetical protein [Nitrospinaceae bacterium]